MAQRSVPVSDIEVGLTNMEFEILYLLASNPSRVFFVEQIYNIIWNYEYLRYCTTISKHISSIRKKTGDSSSRQLYIQTIWGVGYRFNKNLKRFSKRQVRNESLSCPFYLQRQRKKEYMKTEYSLLLVVVYPNEKSATFFIFSNYENITERMGHQK